MKQNGNIIILSLLMMLLVVERVKVKQFILSAASIILAIIIMFPVTVASVSYFPRILKRPIIGPSTRILYPISQVTVTRNLPRKWQKYSDYK